MPDAPRGRPPLSSWRDYAGWLTFDQFYEFQHREHDGWPPHTLFCEARDLAAANLRRPVTS
jgi:hypothetical protein